MKLTSYFVLLAPARTPPAIVALLEREVRNAVKLPDLQAKWRASDIEPLGTSAAEAKATFKSETALWADIVRRAKLQQR
jgi:tripartite-type tricarboxylate transporter receptor subunit TctC